MTIKVPPNSKESEQCVLGSALMSPEACEMMLEILVEDSFYHPLHAIIFSAIKRLSIKSSAVDFILVSEELNDGNETLSYLCELVQNTATPNNIRHYIEIIKSKKIKRDMLLSAYESIRLIENCKDNEVKETLDLIDSKFFLISNQYERAQDFRSYGQILPEVIDDMESNYYNGGIIQGLNIGFEAIDKMTNGFKAGELIIIAARPSMGKTTFAMNIAENIAAYSNKSVVVFSLEMPSKSLVSRSLASITEINNTVLQSGNLNESEWREVSEKVKEFSKAQIYFDESGALSSLDIRSKSKRFMKKDPKLSLIIIDYIQLMSPAEKCGNRTEDVASISRSLKALSKELNIPIIVLSQLNRSLESRPNKRPIMSDIRESGSIEQDADVILFVYRDEVYNENSDSKGIAEIIISKQRNGPIGTIRLKFEPSILKFSNLSYSQYPTHP